jgi:hypothetical protein
MIWTKAELLKTLERYADDDTFAGALWSKEDVSYAVSEIAGGGDYVGQYAQAIEAFEPEEFWLDHIDVIDQAYEADISWVNDELYVAVEKALKGDN